MIASVGCSASHANDDGIAAFVAELDRVACEREIRCESQIYEYQRGMCHPAVRPYFSSGAAELAARGELRFDAGAASRCIAEVTALGCHHDDPRTSTPSCSVVFTPQRALGEPCTPLGFSGLNGCVGASFCAGSDACAGTCAPGGGPATSCEARPCASTACTLSGAAVCSGPAPALGEPCAEFCGELAPGHHLVCVDGTCALPPIVGLGETCGSRLAECEEGATCDGGECRLIGAGDIGAACSGSRACLPELWCDDGACAEPLPPGAACAEYDACGDAAPHCLEGICTVEPEPSGTSCGGWYGGPFGWADPCADDLSCAVELGRCVPAAPTGSACGLTATCAEGNRCVDRVCRTIGRLGDACDADVVCPWLLECRAGRCEPLPVLGEACADHCFGAACVGGRCVVLGAGAECVTSAECDSGICRSGVCDAPREEGEPCGHSRGDCRRELLCVANAQDETRCVSRECGP